MCIGQELDEFGEKIGPLSILPCYWYVFVHKRNKREVPARSSIDVRILDGKRTSIQYVAGHYGKL
jgi:hypothetical protein